MQILALHGFTGRGSDFAPLADLCGGEWRCPDLPGHGPEPQLDCTPEATVAFIEKERAMMATSEAVLLGYSLGARAGLQHALAHPAAWQGLILISPNPGIENAAERAARCASDAALAQRINHEGVTAFLEFWLNTPMIRSQQAIRPDWRARMQAARKAHSAEGLAASLRQFGQGTCPNLWPLITELVMPTLLITGAMDEKYTRIADAFAKGRPAISSVVIDGAGHMPQLEAPEATCQAIQRFLAGLR